MKPKANLSGRVLGSVCIAWLIALQVAFPPRGSTGLSCAVAHGSATTGSTGVVRPASGESDELKRVAAKSYGDLPLSFEANHGQADPRVKFLARTSKCNLYLTANEAVMEFHAPAASSPVDSRVGSATANTQSSMVRMKPQELERERRVNGRANTQSSVVRMKLVGANYDARITPMDELPGASNYFIGNNPKNWRTDIPTYSRVKYESIYPGVDVVFYGNRQELEYDLIVAPGASFRPIRIAFDGARRIRLDDSGDVVVETSAGEFHQRKPLVYQEESGLKQTVAADYALRNGREIGFEIGAYDAGQPLIIDPVLSYSTYLGSGEIRKVAVDGTGNAYFTGTVQLNNSPLISNVFVTKLNREGTAVLYSTFLGSRNPTTTTVNQSQGLGIAVDSDGNAYVTGSTNSPDFPTTPGAFQTTLQGPQGRTAAFITKVNPEGNGLVYSTYLGGAEFGGSSGAAIAIDSLGNAYVTGETNFRDFPTTEGAWQRVGQGVCPVPSDAPFSGCLDAFVTKLNARGSSLVYSTFLSGRGTNRGTGIAVDASGSAYVTGMTNSPNFPTTSGALQTGRNDRFFGDAFVTKLNPTASALIYSTLLGGGGSEMPTGIAVDSSGNAYVTGPTLSNDFPTTAGALQSLNSNSTLFKSTDSGVTWSAIHNALPSTDSPVSQVEFDPLNANVVYLSGGTGLFKSTDSGNSWRSLFLQRDNGGSLQRFAIDPTNPLIWYGQIGYGPFVNFQKSTDGGNSWFFLPGGTPGAGGPAISILINRRDPTTVYAALPNASPGIAGIFKSTDGGINWFPAENGIDLRPVSALALARSKPRRLYSLSGGSLYRSTNDAKRWNATGYFNNSSPIYLAVDPTNPNTIFIGSVFGVDKSTNAGESFAPRTLTEQVGFIAIDPKNTSVIYAANRRAGSNKIFKSTDTGLTWTPAGTGITADSISTIAIDPNNTSVLYAGAFGGSGADAFVAKINPTGSALVYSTYLGGTRDDICRAIAVDAQGNAYLTGQTSSADFPLKGATQSRKLGTPTSYDAFLTKLDPVGGLMYSTYLGGSSDDFGWSIALDTAGGVYIAGATYSDDFPTLNPAQPTRNGASSNGFVTKIVNVDASAHGFPSGSSR